MAGEQKAPEILALNPTGTVPFVVIDGDSIFESATVLRYLARKFPSLNKYYPDNALAQAQIDAALDFNGSTLRNVSMATFLPIIGMRAAGQEPPAEVHDAARAAEDKLRVLFETMEKGMVMRGTKYLGGNEISIADFQLYSQIYDLNMRGRSAGQEFRANCPRLLAWYNDCSKAKGLADQHD